MVVDREGCEGILGEEQNRLECGGSDYFAYLDTVRLTGPDNYLIRTRSATRVVSQS